LVTLRVGVSVGRGLLPGAAAGGDAVSDDDLVGSYDDFFDEQAWHSLAVFDGSGGGLVVELGEESFEVFGEGEVGVAIDELGGECVEFVALAGFAVAQLGHPGAQFVEGDQLFLVGLDEAGDGGGGLVQGALQPGLGGGGRVGGAQLVEAALDLGADQRGVGEEGGDVGPDDLVEVVGSDGFVVADPAAGVAVVVRTEAPVVVDGLVGGAGRGAVVGVAAARADSQALQQGRGLAVAGGEAFVVGQAPAGQLKGGFADQRCYRDADPVLAGPVGDGVGAGGGASGQPGGAVERGGLPGAHCLGERRGAGVGGVA
jgi:hypothetical protein